MDNAVGGGDRSPRRALDWGLVGLAAQDLYDRVEIANVRSSEVVPPVSVGTVSGCHVFETLQIAGVGQEIQVDHAYGRCTAEHPANEVRADEPGATGNQYAHGANVIWAPTHRWAS